MIWRSHLIKNNNTLDHIKSKIKEKEYESAIESLIEFKAELLLSARSSNDIKVKKKIIDSIKAVDRLIHKTESKIKTPLNDALTEDNIQNSNPLPIEPKSEARNNAKIIDVLQPLSQRVKNEIIIPLFYQQKSAMNFHGAFIYGSNLNILSSLMSEFQKETDFELTIIESKEARDFKYDFKTHLLPQKTSSEQRKIIIYYVDSEDFSKQNVGLFLQQISLHNFGRNNIRIIPLVIYTHLMWEYSWAEQLIGLKPVFIDSPDYEERLVVTYRGLEKALKEVKDLEHFAASTDGLTYSDIYEWIKRINSKESTIVKELANVKDTGVNALKTQGNFRSAFNMILSDVERLSHINNRSLNSDEEQEFISEIKQNVTEFVPDPFEEVVQENDPFPNEDLIIEEENHSENIERIISAFEEYSIRHGEITYQQGAVFSRYRIPLAKGERINKVTKVINEIKMRLRSPNVRIIAPIENDDAIGIELPNKNRRNVTFKEINVEQKDFRIPVGIDVNNDTVFLDFTKDPHYIIAGSTGSGKSVNLNVIIAYLLSHKSPSEVSMLLIDPKQVEFNNLTGLSHMITNRALNTIEDIKLGLSELIDIMQDRFTILTSKGYRNIQEYNRENQTMPYIVCIIDEFATISEDEEIMNNVQKLSQLSRAAGIHLILATQRPSTDIVSGTIKNNFTGRIAFKVASNHDSRTVIFDSGAEELIGQGDMLIANSGSTLRRAQGAYISLKDLNQVMHNSRLRFKDRNPIQLKQVR